MLIEIIERVRGQFSYINRRVKEIRNQILKVACQFMTEVTSEEEMRFLLLETDLDNRDALNIIYDYKLVELLENPFAHNIVL